MSSTVKLSVVVNARDYAAGAAPACCDGFEDPSATTHDLLNTTNLPPIETSGAVGSTFVDVVTPVVGIERVFGLLGTGSDAWLRFGGERAELFGDDGPFVLVDDDPLPLTIDGGSLVTVLFAATDTTPTLAAKRINYFAGKSIADVADDGRLRLFGMRTGGAGARFEGRSYGAINVGAGAAVAKLGLAVGVVYGEGMDVRLGAGAFALPFPSAAKQGRIELSGSAPRARITVAGSAT